LSAPNDWLWAAFLLSASTAVVATLAVMRDWCAGLDRRLFDALHIATPLRPDGKPTRLVTALRDLAALGGDMLRTILLAVGIALLLAIGERRPALALLLLYAVVRFALMAAKRVIRRPRPPANGVVQAAYTSSFPSGHTLMTIVLFLSVALLIPAPAAVTSLAIPLALVAGAAVGVSRLMLGLHWPSDVLVGWLAGIALASGYALLLDAMPR
jgi:undecaprenyl-diphosphatase